MARRRRLVVDDVLHGAGLVLDAGALIALERRNPVMAALARRIGEGRVPAVTSAGVIAETWRGGDRHRVPLVFMLGRMEVVDLTLEVAKVLGRILGDRGTRDPIDAHVAFLSHERGWPILTSDPDDLLALDPSLVLHAI